MDAFDPAKYVEGGDWRYVIRRSANGSQARREPLIPEVTATVNPDAEGENAGENKSENQTCRLFCSSEWIPDSASLHPGYMGNDVSCPYVITVGASRPVRSRSSLIAPAISMRSARASWVSWSCLAASGS